MCDQDLSVTLTMALQWPMGGLWMAYETSSAGALKVATRWPLASDKQHIRGHWHDDIDHHHHHHHHLHHVCPSIQTNKRLLSDHVSGGHLVELVSQNVKC